MTTDANDASEGTRPERTSWVAELQCFLCGSSAGTIECDRAPLPPHGLWHAAGAAGPAPVADWRQLRCARCGGALFAESVEQVQQRDPPDVLRREAPRRGRPPRWLVEQRRREREAAEANLGR